MRTELFGTTVLTKAVALVFNRMRIDDADAELEALSRHSRTSSSVRAASKSHDVHGGVHLAAGLHRSHSQDCRQSMPRLIAERLR